MKHLPIVIVIAPQGAGKTRCAEALAARYGCTSIVDDWDGAGELQPGTLALTSVELPAVAQPANDPVRDPIIEELIELSRKAHQQPPAREVA